jgi:hypothetical protein
MTKVPPTMTGIVGAVRKKIKFAIWNTAVRLVLFLAGATALTLYGTSLNLAPVEFAQVTSLYIATLFVDALMLCRSRPSCKCNRACR